MIRTAAAPRRLLLATALVLSFLTFLAGESSAAKPRATTGRPPDAPAHARNVIFLIPDGMGPSMVTLLRGVENRPLHLDSLLVGAAVTHATDSRVTDSAAAITALACGVKTANGVIGLDVEGRPVGNLLEAAQLKGMATGLVVTSRITHATPAGFAAHVSNRGREAEIAAQMLDHRIDLLLGGGRGYFLPRDAGGRRLDGRDLLAEAARAGTTILASRDDFLKPWTLPVLGLFHADHMTWEIDRDEALEPSLAEMTRRALLALSRDPDGFFLMVEGSRIDHAAHDNDAGALRAEMQAFDEAVGVAVTFARREGRTLVVSVADHETGGLTLGRKRDDTSYYEWHPEVLGRVAASSWALVREIRGGAEPESVLARRAGLDSLGAPDHELLRAGLAGNDEVLAHSLNEIISRRALLGWTTYGHTAVDVGVYAFGPGRDRLSGARDNTEVAWSVAAAAGLDLNAVTARLRATK